MPDVRFVVRDAAGARSRHAAPRGRAPVRAVDVVVDDWRDPAVDWSDTPFTMLRSPWDYVERLDEFLGWAEHVATVSALWNPIVLIRWNTHKAYLLELAAAGAPVVPTVLLPKGSAASLDGIADAEGWNAVVVKPAVAVGGHGAGRFEVADLAGQAHLDVLLPVGDVLVQQYAPAVTETGEYSVVLVDAAVTHAVRKRPKPGDFRIHERYGGALEPMAPMPGLVGAARARRRRAARSQRSTRVSTWSSWPGRLHVLEVEVYRAPPVPGARPPVPRGRRPTGSSRRSSRTAGHRPRRLNRPVRCRPLVRRPTHPNPTRPKEPACRSATSVSTPPTSPRSRWRACAAGQPGSAALRGTVPGVCRRAPGGDARRGAHGRRRVRAEDERHAERRRVEGSTTVPRP